MYKFNARIVKKRKEIISYLIYAEITVHIMPVAGIKNKAAGS